MRIDPRAATERMNMRLAKKGDEPALPKLTKAEVDARIERAEKYKRVCEYGCLSCCGVICPTQEGGLRCPLLETSAPWSLAPAEAEIAGNCKVPALYAEVISGRRAANVTRREVLTLVPFGVNPETLWHALVEDGVDSDEASTRLKLHLRYGRPVIPAEAFSEAYPDTRKEP